ncbi:MAG: CPBP family intramembrane metalloprotease [Phycisphaerae bacterium]|nr:CPBP family intramembrane metalloprotease [Phycisphaerae bacterium]NIP53198.1 CPBP family intramembrane metalloprotease [Phycisphaerae bacterium]NIS52233.1 CPBP family intramembrane metalloprotease [Phycisphaerae bacterium]NIU09759.1 CPBP family intramembrane metalloprotease [Phycisphaerae bacterium]NIU59179.1 CPBP family intramembrane metalloprotease [Phycisphaerae bacterium]
MEVPAVQTVSASPDEPKPTPWGFWATIGFSCIIVIVYLLAAIIFAVLFLIAAKILKPQLDIMEIGQSLDSNGLYLSLSTCATAPLVIGLSLLFAKIRKNITIKEYFSLNRKSWKQFAKWTLILLLYIVCADVATSVLGEPIVSDFMINAYQTAHFTPLLWLAFIIAAPLYEEVLFRGFMFKGIENSRAGPVAAVIITSLAWAALHVQYNFVIIVSIFTGGLILGWARIKTNSIYIPIAMHVIQNLLATIVAIVYLECV